MRRSFNYTQRQRIPAKAISLQIRREADGRPVFDASIDLTSVNVPATAKVYVEAYYGRSLARFDFGTASNVVAPAARSLDQVEFSDRISFRIKVVDESGVHGRILALADGIDLELKEQLEGGRRSLLPVSYSANLGEEIWRVRFTPTGPVLEVNSTIPGMPSIVEANPLFGSLVWTQALRAILERLLLIEGMSLSDAGYDTWQSRWLLFAQRLLSVPLEDQADLDEKIEWIGEVARAFAVKANVKTRLMQALANEN